MCDEITEETWLARRLGTYSNLVRVRRYGRWFEVHPSILDDAPARKGMAEMVAEDVMRWCRANGLAPVEDPHGEVHGPGSYFPQDRAVAIGEVQAAGIPPEERLPQGWRRWFCAP